MYIGMKVRFGDNFPLLQEFSQRKLFCIQLKFFYIDIYMQVRSG